MQDKINEDIKTALKAGDKETVSTLKMVKTALQMAAIDHSGEFDDDAAMKVLQKEAKKRRDAARMYVDGGAQELADKELKEADVIQQYLPEAMSEADVAKLVDEVIEQTGSDNMGQIIGMVIKKSAGKTDGTVVSKIVKEKLG